MAGDGRVEQVPGEAPPESILRILALLLYQIRLTTSSVPVAVVTVKCCDVEWEGRAVEYLIERMWGSFSLACSGGGEVTHLGSLKRR